MHSPGILNLSRRCWTRHEFWKRSAPTVCLALCQQNQSQHLTLTFTRSRRTILTSVSKEAEEEQSLLSLEHAIVSYPGSPVKHGPWNLRIARPTAGGHALLGRNGTCKSLISQTLIHRGRSEYLQSGSLITDQPWHSNAIAYVSFESHEAILDKGGTASKTIADGGNLNKAAQFLVVRFGLFPFLHRDVRTLSTGEIRKVMLVRALANRPRLLILDNAFDGLDVPSREILRDLMSKTIQGFRVDILVQGVSAKNTAHTQVLLLTHRAEELVDEIATISSVQTNGEIQTISRSGMNIEDVFYRALDLDLNDRCMANPWDDPSLPSLQEIARVWKDRTVHATKSDILVQASHLCLRRGESILLTDLNWTVRPGERWLVAGGNGQGKSTLSRLLAKVEEGLEQGSLFVAMDGVRDDNRRVGVGWVSTELHLSLSKSSILTRDILSDSDSSNSSVTAAASWLGLDHPQLLSSPFSELSQGQQKLVLIGAALASRPDILVVDEPCQGLDLINRNRVLGLVERLCRATDVCLIYITHHPEEVIPSVSHVLHLAYGSPVYNGSASEYDPSTLPTQS